MAISIKSAGKSTVKARKRRHLRIRKRIVGTSERPRLVVTRSARHVFVQVVDDSKGHTLASASTLEADLRTFDLPAKNYALAICTSNTLMHFTSPEEQLAVLQNAHRHLRPGGLLFIDLFNPDVTRLNEISGMMELADQWTDEERGTHMIKWCVRTVDWAEQLQETLFIYEEQFADGRNHRISCPFPLRFLWRNEGQLMLEKAGFTVEEIWGDFDGSEYYSGSDHLIFLARK